MRPPAVCSILLTALTAAPVWAQSFACACTGIGPAWSLSVDDAQARLVFPAPTDMDVMLVTPAQGQDWPRAYTLVGDRDTAIVLIEREACSSQDYRAHVFTQRGQTPILLSGCCEQAR